MDVQLYQKKKRILRQQRIYLSAILSTMTSHLLFVCKAVAVSQSFHGASTLALFIGTTTREQQKITKKNLLTAVDLFSIFFFLFWFRSNNY